VLRRPPLRAVGVSAVSAAAAVAVLAPGAAAPSAEAARSHRLAATAKGRLAGSALSFRLTRSTLGPGRGRGHVRITPRTPLVLTFRHGRVRATAMLRVTPAPTRPGTPPGSVLRVRGTARITGGTGRYRGARGRFTLTGTERVISGTFTARLRGRVTY
jgi:hypothetical protein